MLPVITKRKKGNQIQEITSMLAKTMSDYLYLSMYEKSHPGAEKTAEIANKRATLEAKLGMIDKQYSQFLQTGAEPGEAEQFQSALKDVDINPEVFGGGFRTPGATTELLGSRMATQQLAQEYPDAPKGVRESVRTGEGGLATKWLAQEETAKLKRGTVAQKDIDDNRILKEIVGKKDFDKYLHDNAVAAGLTAEQAHRVLNGLDPGNLTAAQAYDGWVRASEQQDDLILKVNGGLEMLNRRAQLALGKHGAESSQYKKLREQIDTGMDAIARLQAKGSLAQKLYEKYLSEEDLVKLNAAKEEHSGPTEKAPIDPIKKLTAAQIWKLKNKTATPQELQQWGLSDLGGPESSLQKNLRPIQAQHITAEEWKNRGR